MEDLYFEKELIKKGKEQVEETLEFNTRDFKLPAGDEISRITAIVYQDFDDILYRYYDKKSENKKERNEIYEIVENFKKELTNDRIMEAYKKHTFSKEEKDYIDLVEISHNWRKEHNFGINYRYAIIDILLRDKIIEYFGKKTLDELKEIMKTEFLEDYRYKDTINHYTQLFSEKPFGNDISKGLEENIKKDAIHWANEKINCGGYALKIDVWLNATNQENFSQSISSILNRFPFVRLLGDKPLKDDEYLVIYRAPEGKNTGHHFIRVDSDSTIREKDGNNEPRIFESWGNLEECPEAIFAVKKEHEMFGYDFLKVNHNYEKGLDFEETINKSIRERHNSFSYHNHNFSLKKSKEDEIFAIDENGQIVADIIVDESECLVEAREEKRDYIENTSGFEKPIIKDGKLINFEEFKKEKTKTDNSDGR